MNSKRFWLCTRKRPIGILCCRRYAAALPSLSVGIPLTTKGCPSPYFWTNPMNSAERNLYIVRRAEIAYEIAQLQYKMRPMRVMIEELQAEDLGIQEMFL